MESNPQLSLMNKTLNLKGLTINHDQILNKIGMVLFFEQIDVTATRVLSFQKKHILKGLRQRLLKRS